MDIGSFSSKIGFAGDDQPRLVTRSLYSIASGKCGDEALQYTDRKSPVAHGFVTDFELWEKLALCLASKLGVSFEGNNLLITEVPLNPKANREKSA